MANKKLQTEGTFQAPPPDAPVETTRPLDSTAVNEMLARAAANERPLPPFNPKPVGPIPPAASTPAVQGADTTPSSTVLTPVVTPEAVVSAPPPPVSALEALQQGPKRPAESDTDSPSRGIPKAISDPGKQITGGFSNLGEALYFALDGTELRTLCLALMDDLAQRIQNDLRFSIAITYPRVTARVKIEIEGWATDQTHVVECVKADERTSIDVAKAHSDEVVFVVQEMRREFNDEGEPENPPDRLRDELGLLKPRKQFVQAGASKMMVDVPSDLGTSF